MYYSKEEIDRILSAFNLSMPGLNDISHVKTQLLTGMFEMIFHLEGIPEPYKEAFTPHYHLFMFYSSIEERVQKP